MSSRYEYAGFWIRFGAVVIDFLILSIPIGLISQYIFGVPENRLELSTSDVVANLTFIIVSIFCWVKFAGTPGKLILNLKVLDAQTGHHVTIGQAIIRQLAYILSALCLLLGFFWIGFDKKKQGWHDKLAKTVVVKDHGND